MALRDVSRKSTFSNPPTALELSDADISLIAKLLKEDEDELLKAGGQNDVATSTQAARSIWEHELRQAKQACDDRSLAMSLNNAIMSDQHLLKNALQQELQAQGDHTMAALLEENSDDDDVFSDTHEAKDPIPKDHAVESICDVMTTLGISNASHDEENTLMEQTRSPGSSEHRKNRCTSCMEHVTDHPVFRLACSHMWCSDCLRSLCLQAATDEELYPPRCCATNILPSNLISQLLDYKELEALSIKGIEFTSSNRIYCAALTCSAFIFPWMIRDERAQCPKCDQVTHTICRALGEPSHECPKDQGLQEVLALGVEQEWKRCPQCHTMVELRTGCHHITCRCGKEFCYLCGADWPTCNCPLWHENRLIDAANRVVDNEIDLRENDEEEREFILAQVIEELRVHEDIPCEHGKHRQWRWRDHGDLTCEICSRTMKAYIFDCERCHITVCYRCRLHRLR